MVPKSSWSVATSAAFACAHGGALVDDILLAHGGALASLYYWHKGTLKCATINLIGREQEARALIGLESFRRANHNTECVRDSQWEGCILVSANRRVVIWSQPIARPKLVPKGGTGTP